MVSPVIVDSGNETGQLPPEIMKAYRTAGGSLPIVVLSDPAMTKVYGTYSHAKLKGQDYRTIFRDAKRAVSADIKADTFNTNLGEKVVEEKPAAPSKSESKSSPASAPQKDIIKIENPEMRSWKSSRGATIEAKLIGVEDKETFVLVTSAGKTIRVTEDKLSLQSLNEAKKLAGLE